MVCIQAHRHRSLGLHIYGQWTSNTGHGLTASEYSYILQDTIGRCIWTDHSLSLDGAEHKEESAPGDSLA